MGEVATEIGLQLLNPEAETCEPRIRFSRKEANIPQLIPFDELILQTATRAKLSDPLQLGDFLRGINVNALDPSQLEILGEKALSYGHVDLLIKESVPIGGASKVAIEIKLRKAVEIDVDQIAAYAAELGQECVGAAIVAEDFQKKSIPAAERMGIRLVRYRLDLPIQFPVTFGELVQSLSLSYLS
jgi:hypothetical protein